MDSSDDEEIDYSQLHWGSFTRSWRAFQRKNNGFPSTLAEYAHLVLQHPNNFRKVTRRRASFYLHVILKQH
jgi:hypothetical protein